MACLQLTLDRYRPIGAIIDSLNGGGAVLEVTFQGEL